MPESYPTIHECSTSRDVVLWQHVKACSFGIGERQKPLWMQCTVGSKLTLISTVDVFARRRTGKTSPENYLTEFALCPNLIGAELGPPVQICPQAFGSCTTQIRYLPRFVMPCTVGSVTSHEAMKRFLPQHLVLCLSRIVFHCQRHRPYS